MLLRISVDPRDPIPLWKQIEETVRRLVVSRAVLPGAALPSVRDLARELRINPATVVRAYQRLTDAGVLTVKRGEGTFVADEPPALSSEERERQLLEAGMRYANLAATIGATEREAAGALRVAWRMLGRLGQGGAN